MSLEQPSRLSLWVGEHLFKNHLLTQAVRGQEVAMNISSRSTDPFLAALTNPTELAKRKVASTTAIP